MGKLYIEASLQNGRSIISDSYFTAPFKLTAPFYRGTVAEQMIMQASAGILDGDAHELEIRVNKGAKLSVTGQSFTKLFKMLKGAKQSVKIVLEEDAYLEYLPNTVIPFAHSIFDSRTDIYLQPSSKLIFRDILASGRVGMGESLKFTRYRSRTAVYENGLPVFIDNMRLIPDQMPLEGIGFFEGKTHLASLYLYGFNDFDGSLIKAAADISAADTAAFKGHFIRCAANGSFAVEEFTDKIINNCRCN